MNGSIYNRIKVSAICTLKGERLSKPAYLRMMHLSREQILTGSAGHMILMESKLN